MDYGHDCLLKFWLRRRKIVHLTLFSSNLSLPYQQLIRKASLKSVLIWVAGDFSLLISVALLPFSFLLSPLLSLLLLVSFHGALSFWHHRGFRCGVSWSWISGEAWWWSGCAVFWVERGCGGLDLASDLDFGSGSISFLCIMRFSFSGGWLDSLSWRRWRLSQTVELRCSFRLSWWSPPTSFF